LSEARSLVEVDRRPDLMKYELLDELGHGGMATVYRAYDRRLDREVAVKVIHRHLRENQEVGARFTSEARAVAKLRHPNIVDVYDVSDDAESERYLVVELVRGTTLRRLLGEHQSLPPEIAAAITIEIADALAHAHEHGVVHRDVKPENVLVDLQQARPNGSDGERPSDLRARIKITDFGIAKLLDAQGVTSTGQVLGSPAHMSPEQIEGGAVTPRSDVFGLGVLLYESLVGSLPFDGKNPAQVLRRVLDGKFTPPERARNTVGAGFSRIAARALAHAPEDRYPSTAEMAADLKRELARTGFGDYRRELEDYLCRHREYLESYEDRVVAGLVAAGKRAQVEREVPVAAAAFNRALAYRPDNPELLRLVSGLAHAQRIRQTVRSGAIGLVITVVIAALTYGGIWLFQARPSEQSPAASSTPPPVRVSSEPSKATAKAEPPSPGPSASAQPVLARKPIRRSPTRILSTQKRRVQVQITGATGGYVLVNGQRLAHGDSVDLQVGDTYSFKFRPPDEDPDCCIPVEKTELIAADTSVVSAEVAFRPGRVVATAAPDGSRIDCGIIGNGPAQIGFSVQLTAEQPVANATCSVIPPTSSGATPRTTQVAIRPGQTIDLWK
jgi:serine/threonine protein kinase